jgi:hypothetical protein
MIDYTLTEEEKADLRERGALMNGPESIRYIVVHCSATPVTADYTVEQMAKDHKLRGFRTIGYHFYIRKDGTMTQHRKLLEVGAHCKPFNRCSIGVCYEGGIRPSGEPFRHAHRGAKGPYEGFNSGAEDRVPESGGAWAPGNAGGDAEGVSVF